jgi:hypothetical protein
MWNHDAFQIKIKSDDWFQNREFYHIKYRRFLKSKIPLIMLEGPHRLTQSWIVSSSDSVPPANIDVDCFLWDSNNNWKISSPNLNIAAGKLILEVITRSNLVGPRPFRWTRPCHFYCYFLIDVKRISSVNQKAMAMQ